MRKQALGILMLDTHFPRIPGDVGNEKSFSFPVVKKTVTGAWYSRGTAACSSPS